MKVHIPGCGDVVIRDMSLLEDPCPPPLTAEGKKKAKRRLDERDKLIYAPMSDVGGVLYDRDATFVEIGQVGAGKVVTFLFHLAVLTRYSVLNPSVSLPPPPPSPGHSAQ